MRRRLAVAAVAALALAACSGPARRKVSTADAPTTTTEVAAEVTTTTVAAGVPTTARPLATANTRTTSTSAPARTATVAPAETTTTTQGTAATTSTTVTLASSVSTTSTTVPKGPALLVDFNSGFFQNEANRQPFVEGIDMEAMQQALGGPPPDPMFKSIEGRAMPTREVYNRAALQQRINSFFADSGNTDVTFTFKLTSYPQAQAIGDELRRQLVTFQHVKDVVFTGP